MSFFMSFDFYSCYDLFFLMLQMIFNNASTICFHNLHKGCDKLVLICCSGGGAEVTGCLGGIGFKVLRGL
jgi:hypothetical protein